MNSPPLRLHPNQISDWKKQFLETAPSLFETAQKAASAPAEPEIDLLYEQIGRLQMELTFFKKKLTT
jgi:transposase